jgi:hypothetical protein
MERLVNRRLRKRRNAKVFAMSKFEMPGRCRIAPIIGMAVLSLSFMAQASWADTITVLGTPLGAPLPASGIVTLQQSDTITPGADCPGCIDWQIGFPLTVTQIEMVTDSSENILDSLTTVTVPIVTSLTSISIPATPVMTFDFTGSAPGTYDLIYILLATEGDNQCNGAFECGLTDIKSATGTITLPGAIVGIPEPGTFVLFGAGLVGAGVMRRRKRKTA